MKKKTICIAVFVLLLAVPVMAAEVEIIGGGVVGHEIGRGSNGDGFNEVFFGTRAFSWAEGTTNLWTMVRYGEHTDANVDGFGGKVVLSDVLWQSPCCDYMHIAVMFDIGFMDKYREKGEDFEVAPTVGGGLFWQATRSIGALAYYEAYDSGPDWKQVLYFGLTASTAFSLGGTGK